MEEIYAGVFNKEDEFKRDNRRTISEAIPNVWRISGRETEVFLSKALIER